MLWVLVLAALVPLAGTACVRRGERAWPRHL